MDLGPGPSDKIRPTHGAPLRRAAAPGERQRRAFEEALGQHPEREDRDPASDETPTDEPPGSPIAESPITRRLQELARATRKRVVEADGHVDFLA